jgi:hypothetical protein
VSLQLEVPSSPSACLVNPAASSISLFARAMSRVFPLACLRPFFVR